MKVNKVLLRLKNDFSKIYKCPNSEIYQNALKKNSLKYTEIYKTPLTICSFIVFPSNSTVLIFCNKKGKRTVLISPLIKVSITYN